MSMSMMASQNCTRYRITNACGHIRTSVYSYCGKGHFDTYSDNKICFESSTESGATIPNVCMGTDYCNRACRAESMGWLCCTCGYKYVNGFNHVGMNLLVHEAPNGKLHGFCPECADTTVRMNKTVRTRLPSFTSTDDCLYEDACSYMISDTNTDSNAESDESQSMVEIMDNITQLANDMMDLMKTEQSTIPIEYVCETIA